MAKRPTADLPTLLAGFRQARERLYDARRTRDPDQVYIAMFETLNWADTIFERLTARHGKGWYTTHEKGQVARGFQYARNRTHHTWSRAVKLDSCPGILQDWEWRAVDELPDGRRDDEGREAYDARISGRAVRHTMRDLSRVFAESVVRAPSRSRPGKQKVIHPSE